MTTPSDATLQQYIDQVFNQFDHDRSGTLELTELANFFNSVFQAMGDPTRFNEMQARQALQAIDRNSDGRATKMELF